MQPHEYLRTLERRDIGWGVGLFWGPEIVHTLYKRAHWFWLPKNEKWRYDHLEYLFFSDFVFSLICLALIAEFSMWAIRRSKFPKLMGWAGIVALCNSMLDFNITIIRVIGTALATNTGIYLRTIFVVALLLYIFLKADAASKRLTAPSTSSSPPPVA